MQTKKVADAAEKLKDQKAGFTLTDFIDDLTDTEEQRGHTGQRTDHQPG